MWELTVRRLGWAVPAVASGLVALCASTAVAKPMVVYVFGPATALGDSATAVATALDACPGFSAMTIVRTKTLPVDFGSEEADVYVTAAGGNPPQLTITVDRTKTRERLGTQTLDAAAVPKTDLCPLLNAKSRADAQLNPAPVNSDRFFDIVPDADADRPFADLLLYRLREFGYDGQLAPNNYDQTIAQLGNLCATKRRLFRYHLLQSTSEQKNQGSSTTTTAIAGTVLACDQNDSIDTLYAAPKTEKHYISFGTLVSGLVGLAVALKPKIASAQMTASIPLFANLVNVPDTLAQKSRDATSEAFRVMMCRYTKEHQPTDPALRTAYAKTYTTGSCSSSRTSRAQTGFLQGL